MARHNPASRPAQHKGMGFAAAVESARAGGARDPAAAIAAGAQKASSAAKRKNPNLTKVGGVGKNKKAGAIG
jgi:hypothetical protein